MAKKHFVLLLNHMTNLKTIGYSLTVIAVLSIAACKTSKKSTTSTTNSTEKTANNTSVSGPVGPLVAVRSKEGINPPGDEELVAIQAQFPEATMTKLNEGHELYAKTACLGCHNAKSIYKRDVSEWKDIIDDMSARAKLTASQKDAVYKYVLAIKATQPK